ncbi:MAG: bifunctional methylenetetrahydrofolate dehydrogenase/methenyltetrahydrofolate cyclohydrolase FolD [Clostridiales bacterium]|jgi:methylenetetrahydrofolate dehydrogenase (NADP+)/methenyltetrahydrofolate cyclohydrolase|nr:bifunctional methylenetetrahydrofolate dehydrogenase/methenyltetrahydrofolate cyclohydrolase FolD [Clostridiales bacterium]HOB63817.1 bifunctional methylenetetrahydrofolate dehydrogenase/methenyltetrahydrofolate cyclohydrolase FolD [Clostridia bacterium]
MRIIDGKSVAQDIKNNLKTAIARAVERCGKPIGLAVILVGDNPASKIYTSNKVRACEEVGISSYMYEFKDGTPEEDILSLISRLNADETINGILVQLPLPKGYDEGKILKAINVHKDVDGFSAFQIGRLNMGDPQLVPCTPLGVLALLDYYNIPIEGKNAVVVGRSNIVGKPVASLLLFRNATVTICHSRTPDLAGHTKRADILVAAVGRAKLITADMVKEGAVVIDVGINRTEAGLAGDVDFESVAPKASYITPVPGGVGPMTIAMLMSNTLKAYELQNGKD